MKKILYIMIAVVLASCGGGQTFEASNGTVVTYHAKGKSGDPSDTLISFFLLKYETANGKSLFESTIDAPSPIKIDSNFLRNKGDFFEILGEMEIGDSISYQITASTLFLENFKGRLPDSVNAADMITVYASFLEQVGEEQFQK